MGSVGLNFPELCHSAAKGQVTSDDMSIVKGRYETLAYDTFRGITTYGYGNCCTARLRQQQQLVEPAGQADHDHLGLVRRGGAGTGHARS